MVAASVQRDDAPNAAGSLSIAVVAVFLNESRYLPSFLSSLAAQTRLPDLVVLADDGSTDASGEIADAFAAAHARVIYLRLPLRPTARDRLAAAHELRAFQHALELFGGEFDVVAKVDADLDLTPRTIETLEQAFLADPRLGMAGVCLSERERDGTLTRLASHPEHVHGATKFYRHACWAEISPLQPILGWDTVDEMQARRRGWRTASLEVPGGDTVHLRRMGTHGSILASFRRWGVCSYGYGAHPLQVAWYALVLMRTRKPRVLGGINYLVGWSAAWLRRAPQADRELRAEVRSAHLARMRAHLAQLVRVRSDPS
jgi:glycosyltransferase involved in cell wall biosynthesis